MEINILEKWFASNRSRSAGCSKTAKNSPIWSANSKNWKGRLGSGMNSSWPCSKQTGNIPKSTSSISDCALSCYTSRHHSCTLSLFLALTKRKANLTWGGKRSAYSAYQCLSAGYTSPIKRSGSSLSMPEKSLIEKRDAASDLDSR